ncbi:MAG: flagellar basal body L-ring protein FlgH [Planctomycetes bacterium]|nr:flagellar basal body L-ring protein FlgH [Planctomycetota bacterium]
MKIAPALILMLVVCSSVEAQSSSIAHQAALPRTAAATREDPPKPASPVIEKTSIIAVKTKDPKKYKVHDLVTIIVRDRTLYEADVTANARRQSTLRSELDAFIRFTGGGIGASPFRRGKPNINYRGTFNQRNNAESEREDSLTTRITAEIVDVKPNGNLVVEATAQTRHDKEVHTMRFRGMCRSIDVTPDNTVLSTQIANKKIDILTKGSIRNATRPGWAGEIYDWIRPL